MTAEIHAAATKNTPTPEKKGRLYLAAVQAATGNKNVMTHEITRRRAVGEGYIFLVYSCSKVERHCRRVANLEDNT